jgi:hypothetical protein
MDVVWIELSYGGFSFTKNIGRYAQGSAKYGGKILARRKPSLESDKQRSILAFPVAKLRSFWEEKLIPLICQRQKRTGFKPGTSPSKIAWATFPNTSLLPRQRRTARARRRDRKAARVLRPSKIITATNPI